MEDQKIIMFRNRLQKLYRHLRKQAKRFNVSCYRLYDHDLPEFPLCIEWYEGKLYVAEYKRKHGMSEEEHDEWMQETLNCICEVLEVPHENIFLKLRQRKTGRLGQYQKFGDQQNEFVVTENGFQFIVNLTDYLDTGIFLDHRITRQMVRLQATGKKTLNLFCYTGSFSVYAAAGGAVEVHSIDLSNTYLNWAKKNMVLNGFNDQQKYFYRQEDVIKYLSSPPTDYFDIVVMDPPTFSNSKKMEGFLDIQQDHVTLINQSMNVLKPGGILYFSTNYRKFILDVESIHSKLITDITKATTPFDFEGKLFRKCFTIEKGLK